MRKDVRTGAIIGGLLIAVLIVYGVVASRSHKKPGGEVVLRTDKPSDPTSPDAVPTAPDGSTAPGEAPSNGVAPAGVVPVAPPGLDSHPSAASDGATKSGANWAALLRADDVVGLMPAKTQTPDATTTADARTQNNVGAPAPELSQPAPRHDGGAVDSSTSPGASPTSDAAAPATPTTYVVKSGDTFSSIARAIYGDARLYKKIMEANPKVNPSRMRAGTTITLPGKSQPSHESASADAALIPASPSRHSLVKPLASVNSATEYRVTSNDNLYRISMKLYNTPNKVDLIYQFNKTLIGPDPAKLKLNMVLKLPEPPTQTASTR